MLAPGIALSRVIDVNGNRVDISVELVTVDHKSQLVPYIQHMNKMAASRLHEVNNKWS